MKKEKKRKNSYNDLSNQLSFDFESSEELVINLTYKSYFHQTNLNKSIDLPKSKILLVDNKFQ